MASSSGIDLLIGWARLVPRRRIFATVDAARDPEAFPAKSLLSDFALACVAEQLVAFIGRNSFFCLDFATRKFAGGRFHREPATGCRLKPMLRLRFWDQELFV
jgi:hypothetical protein